MVGLGLGLGLQVRCRAMSVVGIAPPAQHRPPSPFPLALSVSVVVSSSRKGKGKRKRQSSICLEFSNRGSIIIQQAQKIAQAAAAADGDGDGGGDEDEQRIRRISDHRKPHCLLVERYQDGTAKRYTLDNNSQLQAICEEHDTLISILQKEQFSELSWLPHVVREFILPTGFPGSVSDDYLEYMLLQFPTNVTGWVCHALVTSSLLKAVGVGSFTSTSAAASAAAIRWVTKDGLGAIGRLFIGGRFGNLFDDDPKKWRMYADFIGSSGSIFELSTQMYPAYFLPLASVGNLAKAVARGLKDPSFRVIQNHFAIAGNLGEVAAKNDNDDESLIYPSARYRTANLLSTQEEVWEVTAQLLGLAVGILIMDTPGIQTSYVNLSFTWFTIRLLHLCLRYQSLSVLRFRTINLKRAQMLVKSHVLHHTVPGYVDCNKEENILSWERFLQPRITFGVSMEKMVGREGSSNLVTALLELYTKQKYILFVNHEGSRGADYLVTFKVGATSLSVLKSMWHAHWLHEHPRQGADDDVLSWLEDSLPKLEQGFAEFLQGLERAGWEKRQIILKVPQDILFHETKTEDPEIVDE